MPNIPWDVIGAGGGFAILVLAMVFVFLIRWKKSMIDELKGETRRHCIDDPSVKEAMKNNIISAQALLEMKADVKTLTKELIKQTVLLKIAARKLNGGPMDFDLD